MYDLGDWHVRTKLTLNDYTQMVSGIPNVTNFKDFFPPKYKSDVMPDFESVS